MTVKGEQIVMRFFIALLLSLFSLSASSCDTRQSPSATMSKEGDVVRFAGEISAESAASLVPLLDGARRLIIYSEGGDVDGGILIGNAVIDNGITVEVETLCASSCAHYIFSVAPQRVVPSRAVVLFHTSPYTWVGLAQQGLIDDGAFLAENAAKITRIESLFNRGGVSPGLLVCASNSIGVNFDTVRASPRGGFRVNTQFAGVYFSEETLMAFGITELDQAHDLSDGARLSFEIEGTRFRVVRSGEC
ncbi:hypothetical protein [Brevundimonas sp.]|jgi:hypothetical protein|uniref:hypothetical protein n=1 Tax=Brevundimonas sp. TaxID=1871086 RepID=UPI00391A6D31